MKNKSFLFLVFMSILLLISLPMHTSPTQARSLLNKTVYQLSSGPFIQNWEDPNLITVDDDWSGVPSIEGYRGDGLTNTENADPQTILAPNEPGILDVQANKLTLDTLSSGGVAEFQSSDPNLSSIALSGSGTADAPYIKIYLDSTGCSHINVKYNIKDLDGSTRDTVQQVGLHYRSGESGSFINIPEAYQSDVTEPNKAKKETSINVTLPVEANDQALLEIRIMTTNASGSDEWIGIDDIEISGTCGTPTNEPVIPNCPGTIEVTEGNQASHIISASDADGIVNQVSIVNTVPSGIEITNVTPASVIGGSLSANLKIPTSLAPGETTVEIQFSNNDPSPQTAVCSTTITVNSNTCPTADSHQIGEIQGTGAESPVYYQEVVTVSGIVTANFTSGGIRGFYIQDPDGDGSDLTSDGLFIYTEEYTADVGQPVQVTGTIAEYYRKTQMVLSSVPKFCGERASITPVILQLPVLDINQLERYENMLVAFTEPLFINNLEKFPQYGEIELGSSRHLSPTMIYPPGSTEYYQLQENYLLDRIILDDGRIGFYASPFLHPDGSPISSTHFIRNGDKLSGITGILDEAFGSYRIQPTMPAIHTATNPRNENIPDLGGNIQIGSFNLCNYFTTLNSRGAKTEAEFIQQQEKLVAAILKIDADILGLIEIENNMVALQTLLDSINNKVGFQKYNLIDTGPIGVDEIKVGIIYQPATVDPVGNFQILDSKFDPLYLDTKNRPALAQSFRPKNSENKFTVVVNHLKSRSSSCEDVGDPDEKEGAGNCNKTRAAAASVLMNWLKSDPTGSNSQNFLIIGDLNAYAREDPVINILRGSDNILHTYDDFTDLIDLFSPRDYSYAYNGQIGYLDYALSSNFLSQRVTEAGFWHINTDELSLFDYREDNKFPGYFHADPYCSSDHDPLILGLDFSTELSPIIVPKEILKPVSGKQFVTELDAYDELNRELSFRILEEPTHGDSTLNGNHLTYISSPGWIGMDKLVVQASNLTSNSLPLTIEFDVQPNNPPTGAPDLYVTAINTPLMVAKPGVLLNDYDQENDPLTAIMEDSPRSGSLLFNSDGSFTYTPDTGFIGVDEFSYRAFDGNSFSQVISVKIEVKPEFNDPYLFYLYLPLIIR